MRKTTSFARVWDIQLDSYLTCAATIRLKLPPGRRRTLSIVEALMSSDNLKIFSLKVSKASWPRSSYCQVDVELGVDCFLPLP